MCRQRAVITYCFECFTAVKIGPVSRPSSCLSCKSPARTVSLEYNCQTPLSVGCLVNSHAIYHAYNERSDVLRRRYHGPHATSEVISLAAHDLFCQFSEEWEVTPQNVQPRAPTR